LIEHDSPTDDKPSLDRLAAFLSCQERGHGAQTEILPQSAAGGFMRARWNARTAVESSTPGWCPTRGQANGQAAAFLAGGAAAYAGYFWPVTDG